MLSKIFPFQEYSEGIPLFYCTGILKALLLVLNYAGSIKPFCNSLSCKMSVSFVLYFHITVIACVLCYWQFTHTLIPSEK